MSVTEAEYRANVHEMFRALDMDNNDVLDWEECRDMVAAVMKNDGGYDAESFRTKYDTMDKNDDGKISKDELIEAVIQIGRERNLTVPPYTTIGRHAGIGDHAFHGAPITKLHANVNGRPVVEMAVLDDPNEAPVDAQTFRQGLSCLGKTFNNARHAYLKMDIASKSLVTLKVRKRRTLAFQIINQIILKYRELESISTCSTLMFRTTNSQV